MKTHKAEDGAVTVNSGNVQLSAAQAAVRRHCLKEVKIDKNGGGVYSVTAPIQFKRGETFGFDGAAGKNGVINDPEAEQMAKLEAEVAMEKKIAAGVQAALPAAVEKALADTLARLKPETAALVRAELAPSPAK
jgi:hypothetical protein